LHDKAPLLTKEGGCEADGVVLSSPVVKQKNALSPRQPMPANLFLSQKDDPAKKAFWLQQQAKFNLRNNAKRAFTADKKVDRIEG